MSMRKKSGEPHERTARQILAATSLRPRLALQLGSGFQGLSGLVAADVSMAFSELDGFPPARVPGHESCLTVGMAGEVPVLLLGGRAHFYEGYSMGAVTFPMRVLAACGIRDVLLTNAAGGIRRGFRAGDVMALSDHMNWMGVNPLRDEKGAAPPVFLDLSQVYDPGLIRLLRQSARNARLRFSTGVYAAVSGPSYETPAEIRALACLGAHAVGMSTVPEAVMARREGLGVAAVSLITNLAAGRSRHPLSHAEVLAAGQAQQKKLARFLQQFIRFWGERRQ
jgi:purine-nucleoside phosphorylase